MEFLERGIKREEKSPRVLQYTQVYLEEGPTKDRKREWPVRSEENKEECHIMSQEKKVTEKEGAIKCQMLISNIFKKQKTKNEEEKWPVDWWNGSLQWPWEEQFHWNGRLKKRIRCCLIIITTCPLKTHQWFCPSHKRIKVTFFLPWK